MRGLLLLAALSASPTPLLGTIPPYPGATRPLPGWEQRKLAIALTGDKPEAVIAYYIGTLRGIGWTPEPGTEAEALAAAGAKQPAWLVFTRSGQGRLDIQVSQGPHPQSKKWVTLIFYQRSEIRN